MSINGVVVKNYDPTNSYLINHLIKYFKEVKNMHKPTAIQKSEKLNTVYATDELGPGGANHVYVICRNDKSHRIDYVDGGSCEIHMEPDAILATIQLQCGPRKNPESIHGVLDTDLLEIVRDRLKAFQNGPFACEENAHALLHIEEALLWMNKRVEDRIERNVLGTDQK